MEKLGYAFEGEKFQSYQFRQINPDSKWNLMGLQIFLSFNRINSDRSIPTRCPKSGSISTAEVSIVSIQTDQSRHVSGVILQRDFSPRFNRINSDRSIPTWFRYKALYDKLTTFQSYQFRQINPDNVRMRIQRLQHWMFQSYQFRQINPDCAIGLWCIRIDMSFQSYQFRQINPD